ncbi:MAG: stage III sporulation protein AB [Clostridiales bacterium]|nr:stage III sporulation protein AB [Clostridiales bacterium]
MRVIIKMIGMCCIFLSCNLAGFGLERRMKYRCLFLREVKEVLQLMENEMIWHRTTLPEALITVSADCRTSLGPILRCCAERIKERDGQSFGDIWHSGVDGKIPNGLLSAAEYQALLDLATAFCNTDAVLQKTQIQKQQQRFDCLYERAQEEWKEKGCLYRRLFGAAGLAIVILLF